jgi:hypothetical protein
MKVYAIVETVPSKRDYRVIYFREWNGDAESLREQLYDWSDGEADVSTLMIRPATAEEIEWFDSENYVE